MSSVQVVCFGEVLWDIFPTYKIIGGAPLNVGLRLKSFGVNAAMISSVGEDQNGREVIDHLKQHKMDHSYIQKDPDLPTGSVMVALDEQGTASYEIHKPVAWDHIQLTQANIELVSQADVFVFGSLVCREKNSRHTLVKLIDHANFKVFDVNLRAPYYKMSWVIELMKKADFIKMNDEELDEICVALGHEKITLEAQIAFIAKETNTEAICITRGGDGAVLFQDNKHFYNEGFRVIVEDTVGAGDSFLATLIKRLVLENCHPQTAIDHACAVGSLVASKRGANARLTSMEIEELMNS